MPRLADDTLSAIRARVREALRLLESLKGETRGPARERAEQAWIAVDDADRILFTVGPARLTAEFQPKPKPKKRRTP